MQLYLFVLLMLFHFIHYNIFEQKANDTCYESYSKHHKCNCEVAAFTLLPKIVESIIAGSLQGMT